MYAASRDEKVGSQMYRIVVYPSKDPNNKYACYDPESEYFVVTASDTWNLWWIVTQAGYPHVEVFNKFGGRCDPTKGYMEMG
jgi:hypothetical protein